ncbi:MAG: DUF5318 family protein [Acidimicrobiales bacterium]
MPFDPGSIDKNVSPGSGVVDYKLQRLHFLKSIETGEIDRSEACEIHPELLRVARSVAPLLGRNCPLCDDGQLRIVAYVFGPRLGGGNVLSLMKNCKDWLKEAEILFPMK